MAAMAVLINNKCKRNAETGCIHWMVIIFPWLFHDFLMTEAKNSMTFYGIRDIYQGKEVGCGRPNRVWLVNQFKRNVMKKIKFISIFMLDIAIFLCWCAGLKGETKLTFMTFMNFPKPGVKFHDFSRFSMTGYTLWLPVTFLMVLQRYFFIWRL